MSKKNKFIPSPHHSSRKGNKVQGIVIHRMAGSFEGTKAWFQNPESEVSAHYLIAQDGEFIQMVRDHEAAWHCGYKTAEDLPDWLENVSNPNWVTIGIECEDNTSDDIDFWTQKQLNTLLSLVKVLVEEYDIPVDRDHILGHSDIDPQRKPDCPGSHLPWDDFMKFLHEELKKEEPSPDKDLLNRVKELFEKNKTLQEDLETAKHNLKIQNETINDLDKNLGQKETKVRELEEELRIARKEADEAKARAKESEELTKDIKNMQKFLRNALKALDGTEIDEQVEKGVNWLKFEFDTSKFYIRWAQIFLWAGLSAVAPVILTYLTGRLEFLGLTPIINATAKSLLDWVRRREKKVVPEE